MTLVSGKVWVVEKFARGHPKGTCEMRVGWVFSAIFDQYVVISRKRCILDTKLLWYGNRKPYASYRVVSVSMTLSDPWPGFRGHGSFKRRVSLKRRILQTQLLPGGPKKRGHSTFSQISRKLLKISKWFFAHIKASVCLTCCIHTNFSNSFYTVAPSGECWTIITNT